MSNEQKKKLSEANMGKHPSEETIKKIAAANKGKLHSEEAKKKMSEAATKGLYWFNNGKINKMAKECPAGFTPGRLPWKN